MKLMNKAEKQAHVEATWADERARKYHLRNDFIDAGDGVVVEVDRPKVKSRFWYRDDGPDCLSDDEAQRKAYFIDYNMRYNFRDYGAARWLECERDLAERGCCTGAHLDEPYLQTWPGGAKVANESYPVFFEHGEDRDRHIARGMVPKPMSRDELEGLLDAIDQLRARYLKRLETYWKRYGDKVKSSPYPSWGDR